MAPLDYFSAARQVAEYEKRKPKKYRNSGWRYCGLGYYRGARYGRILPETGYTYYTTQAWAVLHKCWKGFKIAKVFSFWTYKYITINSTSRILINFPSEIFK